MVTSTPRILVSEHLYSSFKLETQDFWIFFLQNFLCSTWDLDSHQTRVFKTFDD